MKALITLASLLTLTSSLSAEVVFLLVRHGETDWNAAGRIQGQTNIPLNEIGKQQAEKAAEKLFCNFPNINAIYSSDLSRAYGTASATATKFQLPITTRTALREINTGVLEGMTKQEKNAAFGDKYKELDAKYPNRRERWSYTPVPGEETINQLITRVKNELVDIAKRHPNQTVAVFTHGKVIQSLIADLEDCDLLSIEVPNTAIVTLSYSAEASQKPFKVLKIDH